MKKKILVVTERRADYSKLKPLLKKISASNKLDYFLIVTGSHMLKEYGNTIKEIKKDGFKITSTFSMYKKNRKDTGAEMMYAFGRAINNLTIQIEKIKPDIIISGFDIGANFASAIIGAHMNILVCHIEGGEVTGTIDDSIRHATTKFAHIHFTSNNQASRRLIKMGENPKYVFTVGSPSLDAILELKNIPDNILEKKYGLNFKKPFVIMLQHTVTSEIDKIDQHVFETINAIKELDIQAIIIYGNPDAGSRKILKVIKNSKIKQYSSIPFNDFITILKHSSILIGNSSSGIIEAPFLHIPSVNIGTRQDGRLHASSVIDVSYDKNKIKNAIMKAINDKKFLNKVQKLKSLYGDGHTSDRIVDILENINKKHIPIQKKLNY